MEACEALRDKLSEIKGLGPAAQYGLFLADEDPKRGVWLESGRTLEHYLLRENVSRPQWSLVTGGLLAPGALVGWFSFCPREARNLPLPSLSSLSLYI